ncbi:MAG: hypothetical protein AAGC67_22710 [Myxococcota bacterium]
MRVPYLALYTLWILGCTAAFGAWHADVHGSVNPWQVALAFFLAINLVTCVQEICLGLRIGQIERWFHARETHHERPRGSFWLTPVPIGDLFSATFWARMWYEYAYFDPAYADRKSFGFAVDVGNGWSTLIPSVLFLFGMTLWESPLVLGLLGALIFYQKLFNTSLYFFSYVFNRRYELQPLGRVIPVVGGTNGVWILFPAIGLFVCSRLILENSLSMIR